MTAPLTALRSLISTGVAPRGTPLTLTVAPAGEDVTGIRCVRLDTRLAQLEDRTADARTRTRNVRKELDLVIFYPPRTSPFFFILS
jgi:hypothetical protein